MEITKIDNVTFETLYKVLSSSKLSEVQKTNFVQVNKQEIARVFDAKISSKDYNALMNNRKLRKFRRIFENPAIGNGGGKDCRKRRGKGLGVAIGDRKGLERTGVCADGGAVKDPSALADRTGRDR